MARKLLAYGILAITILWLVASYLPEHILLLPKASLEGIISSPIQQMIFIIIMVVFVGIQISLIFSTNRLFREGPADEQTGSVESRPSGSKVVQFNLKRVPELLWTSVPVAMTLVTVLLAFTLFS